MVKRCFDPKHSNFRNYGGRGITVCDEWLNDCPSFVLWAVSNGYKPGLQIDRRDNDKGYSPGNCRFVTPANNSWRRRIKSTKSSSRFRGVFFRREHNSCAKPWRVCIVKNGVRFNVGDYATELEAASAYDSKAVELFGSEAVLNFPEAVGV